MRKKILFIAGMMACCTWAGAQEISQTWVADKGNGTYQNLCFMPTIPIRTYVRQEMISI